jgi:phosphoribosylanthranilate isomerase
VLFDTSGGRGVEAEAYVAPFAGKRTGYAGGMGPENVGESARKVVAVSGSAPVWIDMENRIRTDGYLDLSKCETVARIVAPMVGTIDPGAAA